MTFQRTMNVILSAVCWQFALVYLDDIVVSSMFPRNHIERVRQLLQLLYNAVVTIKLDKCKIFAKNINNLCHVIRTGRLELAKHSADAMPKL